MSSPTMKISTIDAAPPTTLDFPDAIKAIRYGQKVTRLEWGDPDEYGLIVEEKLCLHKPNAEYDFYPWTITIGDMTAADWVIVP